MIWTRVFFLLPLAAGAFAPRFATTPRTALEMGLFDGLFGPKSAEASHILMKGPRASKTLEKLKMEIYKKAIGKDDVSQGIAPEKLMDAFARTAKAKSVCPSKSNGGSLGTFKPGQMVKEFDEVAFKMDVGVIHGPVETEFGSHLIIVTDRE